MKDIVILSGGFGSTLAISQTIGRKYHVNIYVFYLEGIAYAAIKNSKYVTACYDVTSYSNTRFHSYFKDWHQKKNFSDKPVLFCTSDRACLLVGENYGWFQTEFMLTTPNESILKTYNSKLKTSEAIVKNGIKAPRTVVAYKGSNIKEISSNWNFPIIIKPLSADQIPNVGFKVKIVYDKAELERLYSGILYQHIVVIQEYIAGGDDKSWFYIFYRKGQTILSECVGKKILQHPSKQGIMAMGLTMENQTIVSICHSFLETIDYQGIGGIEFKEFNGNYYFIEMSTRAEGFVKITRSTSPEMLLLIYDNFNKDEKVSTPIRYRGGFYYIDPLLTLLELRKNPMVFFKLLKAIFSFHFTFSLIDLRDLKPCCTYLKNAIKSKLSSKLS